MTGKQKKIFYRILGSAVLLALVLFFVPEGYLRTVLVLIPYLLIGYDILRKAVLGIFHGEIFDENFLMSVATVGAYALGEYEEAVAVMLFYQIGELFQSVAVGKSRRNISALMDIRPDYANVETVPGEWEERDPEEVLPGSLILVKPGEKIPIDGVVEEGCASLNTAALTGESMPRDVAVGDAVISGCISVDGLLKIRTTKEFGESTVARILELVENSAMKKSKCENFITGFARYYTPVVCAGALLLALLPPLAGLLSGVAPQWGMWITRALTFLVISCPCALVISIPLSFFGGIGGASARGILVKGSNYLEAMAGVGCVVFDKTGTLTEGKFRVQEIVPFSVAESVEEGGLKSESSGPVGFEPEELLELTALAESFSNHPISRSIRDAWGGTAEKNRVCEVREISGCGVCARVDEREVAVGNLRLMEKLQVWGVPSLDREGTVVHVAVDGRYAGYIRIADVEKADAAEAVQELKHLGVRRTVMLTGDSRRTGEAVAARLGLDEARCELLPRDKVDCLEQLLASKKGKEKLAFVGDGINDAPVLARADIGIAMGALGSDAAIEAADIVLMDDNPAKVALAMRISRKCMGIVWQNIVFSLAVKGICLVLGALGIANMWIAIFADVGVMVLAVLNAMRCLR